MSIGKKTYSFLPGWNKIQLGDKDAAQKELMGVLGCTYKTSFVTKKNKGIVNISYPLFEAVTAVFKKYKVKGEIWSITNVPTK